MYDSYNVFARILEGSLPCRKILEDTFFFSFYDAYPRAPIHVLVIPKGPYMNHYDFHQRASEKEVIGFYQGIYLVCDQLGLQEGGYRIVSNTGAYANQEVPHYHVHILGGKALGSEEFSLC